MKNKNTKSWRAKERVETLDLPLAEDNSGPLWVKRPKGAVRGPRAIIRPADVFERELERLNRIEKRNRWSR